MLIKDTPRCGLIFIVFNAFTYINLQVGSGSGGGGDGEGEEREKPFVGKKKKMHLLCFLLQRLPRSSRTLRVSAQSCHTS